MGSKQATQESQAKLGGVTIDESQIQWVGERQKDSGRFVGGDVHAEDYEWWAAGNPSQVERKRAQGWEVVDVTGQGLDVRCVGLPPVNGTVYMRIRRDWYDRHRAGRMAVDKQRWAQFAGHVAASVPRPSVTLPSGKVIEAQRFEVTTTGGPAGNVAIG